MRRPALACGVIGAAALAAVLAMSLIAGLPVLPSYLAAWLLCLGIPLGALAVLMAFEIAGAADAALASPLRSMLPALPVLAVLSIPLLLQPGKVFDVGGYPAFFSIRTVMFLVLWTLLAVIFMRRPLRPRRAAAIVGLAVHVVIGTVAADDWAQALDPGLASASFGLALMLSQCSAAVAVAVLLAAITARHWVAPSGLAALLLVLLGAWVFMEFTQFLIVWSANLPNEVVWYQHRGAGLGLAAEWTAIGACAAALLVLLPRHFEIATVSLAFAAGAVLFAHVIEVFWLVTPAFRSRLDVTGSDVLAFCGLFALLVGTSLLLGHWTEGRAHG